MQSDLKSASNLAVKLELPSTLTAALQQAKAIDRFGLGFVQPDLTVRELTWRQVAVTAEARAASLLGLKLTRGERIGIFANEEEPFALAFFGAVLAGLIPVPLSPPSPFGNAELQIQKIAAVLTKSGASCVLGPAKLSKTLESLQGVCSALRSHATFEQLESSSAPAAAASLPVPIPNDLCFLQFTSGSTSEPKGVEITHHNLVANTETRHRLHGTDFKKRIGVTWAPLFHDMGLIGSLIASALFHSAHVFIPTMTFVHKPQIWLEIIHRYRATTSTANNFALRAAMKRLTPTTQLDLSCLKSIILGGEPIHPELTARFLTACRPYGLQDTVLSPAYGLAEATLAISITRQDDLIKTIRIARDTYESEAKVRLAVPDEAFLEIVDCGPPIPDHEIIIADSSSRPLGPDCVGEIVVRGPSVCPGYYGDPENTRIAFNDGWLRTGDLGFIHDGDIFVSGRVKDLIIVGGKNYYPQDIEWLVSKIDGIRSHHVIAFSTPGEDAERLIVICEVTQGQDRDTMQRAIRDLIVREFGLQPHDIVIAATGAIPQTTSGKPRRRDARAAYLNGSLLRL